MHPHKPRLPYGLGDQYHFPDPTLFSDRICIPYIGEFEFLSDGNGNSAGCDLVCELFKP